ncbi:Serine/threonine-protein kinase PITSLRE [Dissostichus eleginoides]|uniref:Serine/threonine-protein kinase PITSLRE n=1 Tax=Dissostichus eleginoides TaxID=100907 RepID=A0AAD9FJV7_DISEL|nr:Serine/threonine-protein kinase PITSLRE [Dissostichus eleginoides]
MSQSPNPKDSQALLQSMLQKLKLQPGKECQAYLHTPVPTTAAASWGPDGERGAFNLQKVNSSPGNGFQFSPNGIPSKECGNSAAGSHFGFKGEIQSQGHGCAVDSALISLPSQKDNIDGDTAEDSQPAVTPTGTGQLFPAGSLKDADIASFERTDGPWEGSFAATMPSNKAAFTSMGQNQNQDQSFKPKVYVWSSKPTDANVKSQENEVPHTGNGGLGDLAQSKDLQIVPLNSSSRRKPRLSENKTRRWTQKIKEKWVRSGSFGRKGKEGVRVDLHSEEGTEISPQSQLPTAVNLIPSNKEEERTLFPLDSRDPSNPPPTHTEDEEYMRSNRDFEFGLGSFSLLDEIVTGQEWAKFLNPVSSAASTNQRPTELKILSNSHDNGQSTLILNQQGGVNNPWSFQGTETSPGSDFSMAQISPDASHPVSMDVSEGKQAAAREFHSAPDQLIPMEHGQTRRPAAFLEAADITDNSAQKIRAHLNRKRQHQSTEIGNERFQTENRRDGNQTGKEGSLTSSHVMEETGEFQHDDNMMPSLTMKSPAPPLSPFTPFAPAPRGFTLNRNADKKEASRGRQARSFLRGGCDHRAPGAGPGRFRLRGGFRSREDSMTDQKCEEEPAAAEEEAPARRHALPAWILALKRNSGRKHR